MQKLIKFIKVNYTFLLVILLSAFSFVRMLKPGIYSMQDFHLFRLYEFDKCVKSLQIPCRWVPDAGLGYGEPLFNFYGQIPYAAGEIFHLVSFSFIDSIKILFILSLLGSGISMYFLAKEVWKDKFGALVSSIIYIYAPYRALDVWVRGALPEALSFIIFPLIILAIEKKKTLWFSFLLALLVLTHNLSLVLFLPILLVWIIYRKFWKGVPFSILSLGISAFYVLPAIFESKFITLNSMVEGYFNFRGHFATLHQLLFSRFWGYGASAFGPEEFMSRAAGQVQWVLPLIVFIWLVVSKKVKKNTAFVILFILGWFYLFLTHNKSTFIWEAIKPMAYIQFPWRFLGTSIFCFSLSLGIMPSLLGKWKLLATSIVVALAIVLNFSFFKEDIWYKVNDSFFLTGSQWDLQRTASIGDFWPKFGHIIPNKPSDGTYINYFPGWNREPNKEGLILAEGALFKNTPVRTIGNIISLASIIVLIFICKRKH